MKIKVKKLHKGAKIPTQGSSKSGGWDVYCTEVDFVNSTYIFKTGLAMTPPPGYKITLVPRSSITNTFLIQQNSPGLGDEDYTGEYQYRFKDIRNLRVGDPPYKPGDRIGQLYLEEVIPIEWDEVNELETSERGSGGFGSTGK